ncbi:GSCFA domain-containing protein [Muricoccus radiodurans]|uniref:GSCFA domain-containing protein n=1 Tax=Muricoccus radiodurans TaxID=2231721 RepID=UPI003CF85FDC
MTRNHPYLHRPDYQFWKNEPALRDPALFDPVTNPSFRIEAEEPIVTAGSCFAQHVARHLAGSGFNFLVTEPAHPIFSAALASEFNYGLFTARYGNVYTARQLRQLLERAYGFYRPLETAWHAPDGRVLDPFRPQIQPDGFTSEAELLLDREVHFAAIRRAVESMRVFVFTLGLTEAWLDGRDGAAYPLAPGVVGGTYDPVIHRFRNFGVEEIVADLRWSLDFIRDRNPGVKTIITVSPVPLNATALDRHVAVSTAYSKAVLRVAAEQVCGSTPLCDYFPSYEIITSPFTGGRYFGPDRRNVAEAGVQHVMSVFLRHYGGVVAAPAAREPGAAEAMSTHLESMGEMVAVLCDEERITNTAAAAE